jgi:hypothetical protein
VIDFEIKEITEKRVEYRVEAGPYGVCWTDVCKTLEIAKDHYRRVKGMGEMTVVADDAVRFRPDDDGIVIWFSTSVSRHMEPGRSA